MGSSFFENISVALSAIRMNALRALLTMLIIAFGIMALISMLTAVDGIKGALYKSFAMAGSNSFSISNEDELAEVRSSRRDRQVENPPITYNQARSFKDRFADKAVVSVSFPAARTAKVQYSDIKTPPKINIIGGDESFLATSGMLIQSGRNFTAQEAQSGRRIVLLGASLKQDLFGNRDPMGKTVRIDDQPYMVVGLLEAKGQIFGQSQDNIAIVPLPAAQAQYASQDLSYDIAAQVGDLIRLDGAVQEAMGMFRVIRQLKLREENNFTILKADSLAEVVMDNISAIQVVAFGIGIITLLGAAVGLTNIMLVTVTERTREIGIRKALGANNSRIRNQFLWESLVICQIGGVLGIILGIFIGNTVTAFFKGTFQIPWLWIAVGILLCLLVGIFAGLYPANKAARLDPVESLRHE